MKKLIIKTAVITIVALLFLTFVVTGFFALLFPKSLGDFFATSGMEGIASKLYERNYDIKEDEQSLILLLNHINPYRNDDTDDYVEDLIDYYGIDSVVDAEYYYGLAVVSHASEHDVEEAILFCKNFVTDYGYTEHNPYRTLISDKKLNLRREEWSKILTALNREKESLTDVSLIERDIVTVQSKIN